MADKGDGFEEDPDEWDGTYDLPPGWNLDDPLDAHGERTLSDMSDQYGWTSWRDIIAPNGSYDQNDVRPGTYFSPQDAMNHFRNIGVPLEHVLLHYDPIDDVWEVVIDY